MPVWLTEHISSLRVRRVLSLTAVICILTAGCGSGSNPESVTADDAGKLSQTPSENTNDTNDDPDLDDQSPPPSEDAEPDADASDWPHTFVAEQVDGSIFDAGDHAGQDLVLWFWAPW